VFWDVGVGKFRDLTLDDNPTSFQSYQKFLAIKATSRAPETR
jgi:hypothetical protein